MTANNPTKAGPYTIERCVPARTRIVSQSHRDERSTVIIRGQWYWGCGKSAREAAVKALPPGSFYTEPADNANFAMTKDKPAIVYIFGFGPTSTTYADPDNAPPK